jgi:hypothetical protein
MIRIFAGAILGTGAALIRGRLCESIFLGLLGLAIAVEGIVALPGTLFQPRLQRNALTWVVGLSLLLVAEWINRGTRHQFGVCRLAGLREMNPSHPLSGVVHAGICADMRQPRYLE